MGNAQKQGLSLMNIAQKERRSEPLNSQDPTLHEIPVLSAAIHEVVNRGRQSTAFNLKRTVSTLGRCRTRCGSNK